MFGKYTTQEVYNVREIHHFTVMNYKDHVEWKTNYEAGGNRNGC